jgi:hypothetical protein
MDSIWLQVNGVVLACLLVVTVATRRRAVSAITLSAFGISCAIWGGLMAVREMWVVAVVVMFAALVFGAVASEVRRG